MPKCSACDFEVKENADGVLIHINEDGDQITQDHAPMMVLAGGSGFDDALWMKSCERLDKDLADFVTEGRSAGASDDDIRSQITDCLNGEAGDIWEKA